MASRGASGDTARFYANAIAWLADDAGRSIRIVTLSSSNATWLGSQGFTNVVSTNLAGLPAALAEKLARETVSGSGELLHQSPLDAATLRQNVTSPGGTTAAALSVLMAADGIDPLLTRAVAAAAKRGKELAG